MTQGGHFLLPGLKSGDIGPRTAAVYGTFFTVPILILSMVLAIAYIKRNIHKSHLARFPVAFGTALNFNDWLAKGYQVFFIVAYLLVPTYAAGHFMRKILNGKVTCQDCSENLIANTPWEHLFTYQSFVEIFTDGNKYRFENEITFFPFWQPWVGMYLTMICIFSFFIIIYLLLRRS